MFEKLFSLRGTLDRRTKTILEISGIAILLLLWYVLTLGKDPIANTAVLPKPMDVLSSYGPLFGENELLKNICRSLGYNIAGYLEAILLAIPIGFLLGLIPLVRGLFRQPIDALRYLPLPAAIGLFISLFALGTAFKVHFLAFGILIYLVPVVIQRINEVDSVYLKTVYTLGATPWQTFKTVYFPSVMSRLSDDIRVLTAISWTYIIIAESIGGEGGIGAMIWRIGQRQGRIEVVFALLIIIIIIGIVQDKIFMALDKEFFPHKYVAKHAGYRETKETVFDMIWGFMKMILLRIVVMGYLLLLFNEFTGVLYDKKLLSYLFGKTTWVISLLMLLVAGYLIYNMVQRYRSKSSEQSAVETSK